MAILTETLSLAVILVIFFWPFRIVLRMRWALLVPYLLVAILLLNVSRVVGVNPLGFFVSPGGWLFLLPFVWLAALLVALGNALVQRQKGHPDDPAATAGTSRE